MAATPKADNRKRRLSEGSADEATASPAAKKAMKTPNKTPTPAKSPKTPNQSASKKRRSSVGKVKTPKAV